MDKIFAKHNSMAERRQLIGAGRSWPQGKGPGLCSSCCAGMRTVPSAGRESRSIELAALENRGHNLQHIWPCRSPQCHPAGLQHTASRRDALSSAWETKRHAQDSCQCTALSLIEQQTIIILVYNRIFSWRKCLLSGDMKVHRFGITACQTRAWGIIMSENDRLQSLELGCLTHHGVWRGHGSWFFQKGGSRFYHGEISKISSTSFFVGSWLHKGFLPSVDCPSLLFFSMYQQGKEVLFLCQHSLWLRFPSEAIKPWVHFLWGGTKWEDQRRWFCWRCIAGQTAPH